VTALNSPFFGIYAVHDSSPSFLGRPLRKFAFVSAAAEREYKDLPQDVQDDFGKDLRRIQYGQDPDRPISH